MRKIKKQNKRFHGPKLLIGGIAIGVVLATVGSVGALNGWFGGGAEIPADTMARVLVGYWGFEEGSGAMAYDGSNYGNTGTLTAGPSWTKGKVGSALSFDGTDDYVEKASAIGLPTGATAPFTLSGWVKVSAYVDLSHVFGFGSQMPNGLNNGTMRSILEYNSNWYFWGAGADWDTGIAFDADNNWHFAVISANATNIFFYRDGVLRASSARPAALQTANTYVTMGSKHSAGAFFNGQIDEVRCYNRELSAEEVRYHYNRGGPQAQWKFDEGEGRTVYDSTDNNNDGTLILAGSATSSAWVSGKYGTALSFDGTDDYVDAGNVSSNARTISFWLKRGDTSDKDVIDLGTPEIKISSNAITSTNLTSPTYYVDGIKDATTVTANQWHYITITDTADITASNVDIGKASASYFLGLIDEVRIYNYIRTPEEIRLDYNAGYAALFGPKSDCNSDPGSCMTQGLVGYWGFEEGSGAKAYDGSNSLNNGILYWMSTSTNAWTKGKVGSSLNFDGTDDYVNAGNAAS